MRASPLLLAALIWLGLSQFAFAQQAADDFVAGPPESAAQPAPNELPEADVPPADQTIAPAGGLPTPSEDQVGPDEKEPSSDQPASSSDEVPATDLGQTMNPDDTLPSADVEAPSPEDAAQPPMAPLSPEQAQQPADDLAPPTQAQPDAELAPAAPDSVQPTATEPQTADAARTNPNPLAGLQLESLSATRSLPLFTPSRTPPAVAPAEPEQVVAPPPEPEPPVEAPPPPLQLIGIVMTDADQMALLRNTATGETLRLAPGDRFEDWTIKIVDARSISFQSGDRVQDMKMFETFGPPPPSGEPSGEPFDPGLPQDANNPPPEEPPAETQEPAPDNGQSDIVIPHHDSAKRSVPRASVPPRSHLPAGNAAQASDPDSQIPADPDPMTEGSAPAALENFGPQLGNAPIPLEGALPDANQSDTTINQ